MMMIPANLVIAAATPIIKLCLTASVGVVLARAGEVDERGKRLLGKLVMFVFLPSIAFTKICGGIDVELLEEAWIIPCIALGSVLCGLCVGLVTSWLVAPRDLELRKSILAMSSIGNTGNMPLIFVSAVCDDPFGPFAEYEGCYNRGISCVMLGMFVGMIAQWSMGVIILMPPKNRSLSEKLLGENGDAKGKGSSSAQGSSSSANVALANPVDTESTVVPVGVASNEDSDSSSKDGSSSGSAAAIQEEAPALAQVHTVKGFVVQYLLLNPPVVAIFLGFIFALTPPLKRLMVGGPLDIVFRSLEALGDGLVPAIMIGLGANMSKGPPPTPAAATLSVMLARLLIIPSVMTLVVWTLQGRGLLTDDPMVLFVALLMGATPSAINVNTIATLQKYGQQYTSAFIFYQYLTAIGSLTIAIAIFIRIAFPATD